MFKAGKYYVGDLCYVVEKHEDWMQLLNDTDYFRNDNQSYKGYPIFVASTAHGDGTFHDQFDNKYAVDAGIIGIMPFEAIEKEGKGGNIIDFKEDFEVVTAHGIFYIGDIKIDTYGWGEDEDDEQEDEDDFWNDEDDN